MIITTKFNIEEFAGQKVKVIIYIYDNGEELLRFKFRDTNVRYCIDDVFEYPHAIDYLKDIARDIKDNNIYATFMNYLYKYRKLKNKSLNDKEEQEYKNIINWFKQNELMKYVQED